MPEDRIEWDVSLLLGNEIIDKQHVQLFTLFERLRGVSSGPGKDAECATCISELLKYIDTHFSEEEAFMQSIGFDGLEAHKVLHTEFVDRVRDYTDACGSGYTPYADMVEFLVKWLTEHIMGEDRKIVAA